MFGQDDPVVTDKDVGDFVKQLHNDGQPLKDIIAEVHNEDLVRDSEKTTHRPQTKDSLFGVRYNR